MELYNKYRPKTFDEIFGNDIAVKSVKSGLDNGVQTFLFVGEKGCGKSTLAKCVVNYLGCSELSVYELNASKDRGIDVMRSISDQLRYPPVDGNKIAYIIDECHSITAPAQESLLKIVEDAPSYVYFLFCTTNPEKLISALKSRCSIVNLKTFDSNTMFMLLRRIAHKEGKIINMDILHRISDMSEGSPRNGLKLLSSVLYMDNDDERLKYLDTVNVEDEKTEVVELCRSLLKQEGWDKYIKCLDNLKDELSSNSEGIRQAIMGYANAVLKKGLNDAAIGMIQVFSNVDCYKNGKFGITVGILDFISYMQN